jgi:hypothetical protein
VRPRHDCATRARRPAGLQDLPADDRRRLESRATRVALELRQALNWPDEPITHVWFPVDAVGSLLTLLGAGDTVETGLVGREGVIGLPLFPGAAATRGRAVCQGARRRGRGRAARRAARPQRQPAGLPAVGRG